MRVKVYSTSGPSWQPVKNGKRYNKWVGTVQFTDPVFVIFGRHYFMTIADTDKRVVEDKLSQFIIGQIMEVPKSMITMPKI